MCTEYNSIINRDNWCDLINETIKSKRGIVYMFCAPNTIRICRWKKVILYFRSKQIYYLRIIQSGDVQSDQSFIGECAKKPVLLQYRQNLYTFIVKMPIELHFVFVYFFFFLLNENKFIDCFCDNQRTLSLKHFLYKSIITVYWVMGFPVICIIDWRQKINKTPIRILIFKVACM